MKDQALKGHLDLLLLAVLADGPAHGYAVLSRLRDRSNGVFDLPEGTIYPALHRLEKAGLLTSSWSTESGRRRRTYELSAKGERAMSDRRRGWDEFSSAVGRVLEGNPWPAIS